MSDTDPQAPSLPYTLPHPDPVSAIELTVDTGQITLTDALEQVEMPLYGLTAEEAVLLARAVLAAAGSTARVVCGQPTDTPVPWPCYRDPDHAGGHQAVAPDRAALVVPDSPKMLRETLCVAANILSHIDLPGGADLNQEHIDRLGRLVAECDRHRPLGPDGKHGDRHTPTCGCEDTPSGLEESGDISSETGSGLRCARDPQCTGCQSCWEEAMASQPGGDPRYTQDEAAQTPTITVPVEMQVRILDRLDRLEGEAAHSDRRLRTATSSEEAAPQPDGALDLEAIRERAGALAAALKYWGWRRDVMEIDVPALLAEVDRLRGERDWLGAAWRSAHQRDQAIDGAERLRRERDDARAVRAATAHPSTPDTAEREAAWIAACAAEGDLEREQGEPEPGTYWERVVMERLAAGGAVDMAAVRHQIPALLAELDQAAEERDQVRAEAEWLQGVRQKLARDHHEAALVARYRRLQRDRYRTAWVSARGRAARARDERDEAREEAAMAARLGVVELHTGDHARRIAELEEASRGHAGHARLVAAEQHAHRLAERIYVLEQDRDQARRHLAEESDIRDAAVAGLRWRIEVLEQQDAQHRAVLDMSSVESAAVDAVYRQVLGMNLAELRPEPSGEDAADEAADAEETTGE